MSEGYYVCRVCDAKLVSNWDKDCPHCQAPDPWMSSAYRALHLEWKELLNEEQRHAQTYNDYMKRFMGELRFAKEIRHHVDLANAAQEKRKLIDDKMSKLSRDQYR